ncbi:MAG: beta-lactamase family protein [Flavobacteriales bacterium]|nr:beta-lactamase family protein [Flavobacteriales bacterium]
MLKRQLLAIEFVLFSAAIFAQDFNTQQLSNYLDTLNAHQRASGALALRADGKLLFSKSIGVRNTDESGNVAPDDKTAFRIGSISKTFTAVMIMQLVQKGDVSLDDPLSNWYPSVPNAANITIKQMLNHSSGIYSITSDPEYLEYMETAQTHEQMLQRIYEFEPAFAPGTKHSYSNSNFVLLGYILEKETGISYAQLVEKKITKPLKFKRTYYGGPIDPQGQNEAQSYEWDGRRWIPSTETDMSIPHGAGSMVSTAEDLTTFITALFSGKLIGDDQLSQMTTVEDGYGLGIFPIDVHGKEGFGHNGGIDDFAAVLVYVPEDDLAIAFTANVVRYDIDEMRAVAASAFYGDILEMPTFVQVDLSPEYLHSLEGTYKSETFPLPIEVRTNGAQLTAQAEGQPELPLEPQGDDVFTLERAGIVMTFSKDESGEFCCFHLEQGQFVADFKKE